jgi:hypothetical protein
MHPVNKLLSLNGLRLSRINNYKQNVVHSYPKYSYRWLNYILFPEILMEGSNALRPNYTWGLLQGVNLARALGIRRVSVIEFGVAGGNGLVSLEKIAEKIENILGVEIDIYGLDAGSGLPKPKDYRDEPHVHIEGDYKMDVEKLQRRLKRAKLILGLVDKTVEDFIKQIPSPIAFVSIDLDYYNASMEALRILDAGQELLLPRIYFYFDDIMGPSKNEYAGERLAISDFNASHEMRKITPIHGLKYHLPKAYADDIWVPKFFIAHIFNHELYGKDDGLSPAVDLSLQEK